MWADETPRGGIWYNLHHMSLKYNLIGAAIGLLLLRGFWGALIGWFVGGYVYSRLHAIEGRTGGRTVGGGSRRGDSYSTSDESSGRRTSTASSSGDGLSSEQKFLAALMALAAVVMKADGHATRDELGVVKAFLAREFPDRAEFCLRMLRDFTKGQIPPRETKNIARRVANSLPAGERLVLLQFLVEIASADGNIAYDEIIVLRQVASGLRVPQSSLDSILAMFVHARRRSSGYGAGSRGSSGGRPESVGDEANDYAILEVSPSASNEEIKKSFRRLAMKHHPDRVATSSPAVQKAAAEKFKRISAAYDRISRKRGI